MATSDKWARVLTTLPHPLPPSVQRTSTLTPRLLIRPLAASDLDGFHQLASQHEVMKWTAAGRAHASQDETRKKLAEFLPPNDSKTFNFAICLRATGEFIGIGGVHRFSQVPARLNHDVPDPGDGYGWPELGYLLKKEFWGKGLATEFATVFLGMWEQLQRGTVEVDVHLQSLVVVVEVEGHCGDASTSARETLVAIVDPANGASRRLLEKCGFEQFDSFIENHGEGPDQSVQLLLALRYFPKKPPQQSQQGDEINV